MARIRTIKPEFFTSEDIVSLTPLATLENREVGRANTERRRAIAKGGI